MSEPEALTGVVEPATSADVQRAVAMLNDRKSTLLDLIVEQKKISTEAMAKVKSAREMVTVDRLLNATTPRKTGPRKPPAAKKK